MLHRGKLKMLRYIHLKRPKTVHETLSLMCFIMIYGLKIMEVHFYFLKGDIVSELLSNGPWPPAVGEHLTIKYRYDQIKIGEFVGFVLVCQQMKIWK